MHLHAKYRLNRTEEKTNLISLVVKYNEVSVAHIEAGEMIAGVFGIENILVHNKCSSSRLGSVSPVLITQYRHNYKLHIFNLVLYLF